MKLRALVQDVEAYTMQRLPRYISELRRLCAIDSSSYHKPGLDMMADYLVTRMHDLGLKTQIIEQNIYGNDALGIIRGSGAGNILLLGHSDTVYPVGTAAERPLCIEGDTMYGPGVSDMKGGILSAIYAVEALLATGCRSFGELRLLWVSDEEITERHSLRLMQEVSRDCRAALVLEAARENGDIVSTRKGCATYKLLVWGRAAHSGVEPEKGRNAITELAHQILQFESLNGWRDGLTINPGVITGGTVPNVVPDQAGARISMRFMDSADRIATEKSWCATMQRTYVSDVKLTLETEASPTEPMICTPAIMDLVCQAQEIARLLDFSLNHTATGGTSDANHIAGYGIPVLDGLGPVGGRDHSPDEYLHIPSVAPRVALLAGLIASIAES